MSSNGFLLSLDIDRRGSWRVVALAGCVTILALTGVSLSGLPWQPRVLAATLVLACGWWEAWRAAPISPRYVTRIHVSMAGQFFLSRAGLPESLVPATVAQWWAVPGLAIGLVFLGQPGYQAHALVFRDQLPPDVWRRLQVRLRHRSDAGVDPARTPASPPTSPGSFT